MKKQIQKYLTISMHIYIITCFTIIEFYILTK